MILRFYPTKDSTIYEQYPVRNTGLDAILEINKKIIGSSSYNSRVLIDFDYANVSSSIVGLGYNPNLFSYSFKMYIAEANEIPMDYDLHCYPISGSWKMGIGRYGNSPQTTDGVSWMYRDNESLWITGSYNANTTGSWNILQGGGVWYDNTYATQSFSYTTSDVDFNVTNIIQQIQSGSLDFTGFLIKRSDEDEQSTDILGSLKFFSKDTHTVYIPVLEAKYDDSVNNSTLPLINTEEDYNIIVTNMQAAYAERSTPTIRISSRYRYPVDTFATQSNYLTRYKLPTGSQYAVYNANSDEAVINFSQFTKISDDNTSNYIKLHLDSFQPERYYRLLIKVPNSGSNSTYQIHDNNWIFKVTRSQ